MKDNLMLCPEEMFLGAEYGLKNFDVLGLELEGTEEAWRSPKPRGEIAGRHKA